jgi:Na+/phosphate symporter
MWYLYFIFVIKLLVIYLFIKQKRNPSKENAEKLAFMEKIFTLLLCILMIYLFHPFSRSPVLIDKETKLFLFSFAVLTATHSFF